MPRPQPAATTTVAPGEAAVVERLLDKTFVVVQGGQPDITADEAGVIIATLDSSHTHVPTTCPRT